MTMPAGAFSLCATCRTDPPHACADPRCCCAECHSDRVIISAAPVASASASSPAAVAPPPGGFHTAGARVPDTRNARAREDTPPRRPRRAARRTAQGTGRGGHGWVQLTCAPIVAPDRPTRRNLERRAEVAALLEQGRIRDAFNVASGGVAGEIAKVARTRPADARAFWLDLISQFLDLAEQIPNSTPDVGSAGRDASNG